MEVEARRPIVTEHESRLEEQRRLRERQFLFAAPKHSLDLAFLARLVPAEKGYA